MAKCKDCIHFPVCEPHTDPNERYPEVGGCSVFKRKDLVEVVRCKDCKHRGEEGECPMYFVKEIEWDDDGYTECDYVPYDRTVDDGFCDRGERGEGE